MLDSKQNFYPLTESSGLFSTRNLSSEESDKMLMLLLFEEKQIAFFNYITYKNIIIININSCKDR